jgi:hypothetical protein
VQALPEPLVLLDRLGQQGPQAQRVLEAQDLQDLQDLRVRQDPQGLPARLARQDHLVLANLGR